jgi:hypothetical protein
VQNPPENDNIARARLGRQVFAGSEIQPPDGPTDFGADDGLLGPEQIVYLIGIALLLVIGLLLLWIWGLGIAASIAFFLLAIALLAAWFLF